MSFEEEKEELRNYLLETGVCTEEEFALVTSINGTNLEAMESILYSRTGYRSLEQILDNGE